MKRWPLQKAYFWETAPFFRILLPFAVGILCYDRMWLAMPGMAMLAVVCVAFLLMAIFIYTQKKNFPALFLLQAVIMFSGGLTISHFSDVRNSRSWFGKNVSDSSSFLVRLIDAPAEKENSWKVPVRVISSIRDGKVSAVTGDAFVYLYKDRFPVLLHKGDTILVPGKWQPIKNAGNPFDFDYATYCRHNGLVYQQFCSPDDVRLYAAGNPQDAGIADRAHDWCMQQLDRYITDKKTKGLIQAMLLGDEVNLDEDLLRSYSETGIIHIIAISGGNVSIFFVVISALLFWMRHKKHLWVKYAIALPLVWFYVVMAGAPPSAVRAAIMFSLLAFSVMLQQRGNGLNQLLATAFLLLCAQPMWLFSVGFQLSFVAVLSLILFYRPVYKWLSPVNKIAKVLWATVAASIAAEILTAPLVVYYFHMFPLLFIVANAAAYLFMGFVLIAGIVLIVLSFIPVMAKGIGIVIVWVVTVFDKIVVWLQSLNPVSFHFLMLTGFELLVLYLVITGFARFFLKKEKAALFTGLIAGSVLLMSFCNDEWIRLRQHLLVVYNCKKTAHVELINGNTYRILPGDTTTGKKIDYVTGPVHIARRAWQQENEEGNELTYINGKSLLILNGPIDVGAAFPVDYLVVNCEGQQDAEKLKHIFSPSTVILGNKLNARQREQFIKDGTNAGLRVYAVADRGAFVLE